MDWKNLTSIDQLEAITANSFNTPQVLFKHSTRCSISSMAMELILQRVLCLKSTWGVLKEFAVMASS